MYEKENIPHTIQKYIKSAPGFKMSPDLSQNTIHYKVKK